MSCENGELTTLSLSFWVTPKKLCNPPYYSKVPFTGKREEGYAHGSMINGLQEGAWVGYTRDGSIERGDTGTFKDGVKISD